MAKIGDIIDGKYEILKEIGRSSMSNVYLALDKRLNKQWAVKEVKKQVDEIIVHSIMAEADLIKKLDHPGLPSIKDIIDNEISIYIVMDYIVGESLDVILKKYGAQPQTVVVEWAKQLCDILGYLHSRKPAIIYRDMKPSNIIIGPDGKIKLIDFGIAREYKSNTLADTCYLGTRGYAAPEQYGGGGQTDARTDIYGLGVTLYYLLTDKNPTEPPYEIYPIRYWNSELSSGLEDVIQKCTKLNPDERYQSCGELMYALEHYEGFHCEYKKKSIRKIQLFFITLSVMFLFTIIGTITLNQLEIIFPLILSTVFLVISIVEFFYFRIAAFLFQKSEKKEVDVSEGRRLRFNEQFISDGKSISLQSQSVGETVILTENPLSNVEEKELKSIRDSKLFDLPQKTVFLSYCSADSELADIIDDFLRDIANITVSRYTRNVKYKKSFKEFMDSLTKHDFVVMLISDKYLKSRACMYEVNELLSDRDYQKKIIFIIISENDKCYYKTTEANNVSASIYSFEGRLSYIKFWEEEYERLYNEAEKINSTSAKIEASQELRQIRKIIDHDIGPFLTYLSDARGISFGKMYESGFREIIDEICVVPED